jgi:hypothetical protein
MRLPKKLQIIILSYLETMKAEEYNTLKSHNLKLYSEINSNFEEEMKYINSEISTNLHSDENFLIDFILDYIDFSVYKYIESILQQFQSLGLLSFYKFADGQLYIKLLKLPDVYNELYCNQIENICILCYDDEWYFQYLGIKIPVTAYAQVWKFYEVSQLWDLLLRIYNYYTNVQMKINEVQIYTID